MDFEKWLSAGERLGLKNDELRQFVEKKVAEDIEREDRYQRREMERIERESALKQKEQEREIDLLKMRIEAKSVEDETTVASDTSSSKSLRPKLPKFEEGKDDMDAYIERFERFAKSNKWSEDTWAISLSSLLTGKGLEVYTSMPADQVDDYPALKKAVLKRYELTEEGFRVKFRESLPEKGETVFQYIARLTRYCVRWTEMSEIEHSFNGLVDLLIREQFIHICSPELALFLRERKVSSVKELTTLAEQYIEAHGGTIASGRTSRINAPKKQSPHEQNPRMGDNASLSYKPDHSKRLCFSCNRVGHIARDCPGENRRKDIGDNGRWDSSARDWRRRDESREPRQDDRKVSAMCMSVSLNNPKIEECVEDGELKLANGSSVPVVSGVCTIESLGGERNLELKTGYVGDTEVKVLRDTGCELAAVRKDLISEGQFLDKKYVMITIDGQANIVPSAKISVDTPYYKGEMEAMVLKSLICDLVIGNISGATINPDEEWSRRNESKLVPNQVAATVVTRAMSEKEKQPMKALHVPTPSNDAEINVEVLKESQKEDTSLSKLWDYAKDRKLFTTKGKNTYGYEVRKDILYRIFEQKRGIDQTVVTQIVVPTTLRKRVMELAHESIVGGHLSVRKTEDRILSSFHWPGVSGDVTRFCRSCDVCQKTIPRGRVSKVALGEMPIIDTPFHRVAVDLIGPITPVSGRGNRYILTVVDYATRYPEAVALPRIESERIAEALLEIFSRVGFPSEILSDRGTQFTSELMAEVSRLVSIRQLFTTPYNPKCNGLCERMNGVLKSMLKKMCQERPSDWDRYLSAVLFAYREVPQASTGFSPFELLYGRTVRGPMQVLKELWTDRETPETRSTYEYVLDLRQRLEETCQIARENLSESQRAYKHHYDKTAKRRVLKGGDKVLILLPSSHNKMMLHWKGPFEVVEAVNKMDYRVKVGNKVKVYHINLLKKYEERQNVISASVTIIESEQDNDGAVDDENLLDLADLKGKETFKDVLISEELSDSQRSQVQELLEEFSEIFTEVPGDTNLEEHKIELTSKDPIRVRQYPLPYAKLEDVDQEVKTMLEHGVIEPALSEYNSPILLVKKKDGSNRFVVDFRKLNAVTKFDAEPMSNVEDILVKLKDDKFFSKIDLAKGYWQIPIERKSRHVTAFSTNSGCYQFRKMPFGMVNSGATFNRMMRKLLDGCKHEDNYVDDVLGHTITWEEHLGMLRDVFSRLQVAKLTVRPTKCMIGYSNISFTGHVVGNGVLQMEDDKLNKIRDAAAPKTKKQVRAFLGLAGYYRKFIPSFAEVAAPLTDLTKKGLPNQVKWEDAQDQAFKSLKDQLTQSPILRLPDFNRQFILQCDASETGIGAALLQSFDDGVFPIAYASKKLLQRERNYSVIERECLSIVFGIKKFQRYLYGKEFTIQTDHAPLSYIQKCKIESGRIMRWAMFLQNYRFRIEAIKGSDNVCADYLSRV